MCLKNCTEAANQITTGEFIFVAIIIVVVIAIVYWIFKSPGKGGKSGGGIDIFDIFD